MKIFSPKFLTVILALLIFVIASIVGSLIAYALALLIVSVIAILAFIVPNTNPELFLSILILIAAFILGSQQLGANQSTADELLKSSRKRIELIMPKEVLFSDATQEIERAEWGKISGTGWKESLNWNMANDLICPESPIENLQNFYLYKGQKPRTPWRMRKMLCANIFSEILLGIGGNPDYLRIGEKEAVMVKRLASERKMVRFYGDSIYFSRKILN